MKCRKTYKFYGYHCVFRGVRDPGVQTVHVVRDDVGGGPGVHLHELVASSLTSMQ
jgi:hypothetical protein